MKLAKKLVLTASLLSTVAAAGCGEVSRSGRSPSHVTILNLEAASGAEPDLFSGTLRSDVSTLIERADDDGGNYFGVYNDLGRVTMRLTLKDPGIPGITSAPSDLNAVTFTRYRVTYRRADGRNVPGTDVPYPFDSAATFTVAGSDEAGTVFDLVRHTAKREAPLAALGANGNMISTIADISFFGRDQAGNEVTATGSIGIFFGNFADPN